MELIKLAFLNIFRNKKRSFLNTLILSTSAAAMMIIAGFGLFTYQSLKDFSVKENGNIIIATNSYFDKLGSQELSDAMDISSEFNNQLEQLAKEDENIDEVFDRLEFSGIIATDNKSLIFLGQGIKTYELRTKTIFLTLQQGELFSPTEDNTQNVIIGSLLAEILGVKIGDSITLLGNTVDGILNAIDLSVSGIVKLSVPQLNKLIVYMDINTAKDFLQTDKISRYSVYLNSTEDKINAQVMQKIEKILGDQSQIRVENWLFLAGFYDKVKNLYNRLFLFFVVILLILVFFSIYNATNSSVHERSREIGALRAIGFYKKEILQLFVYENGILVIASALIGVVIYFIAYYLLLILNIQLSPPPGVDTAYPLYINFSIEAATLVCILIVISSIIGAIFSISQTSKKPITELLWDIN